MAAESSSIVEDWLRSVNLVQYTQSFLDNGYDDLEVCKQIGEDDLDAIGVPKDEHREKLLRAVKVLREEGGTAVYFTLEECDTCQSGDETEVGEGNDDESCPSPSVAVAGSTRGGSGDGGGAKVRGAVSGGAQRLDAYDMGKTTLVTYPKVQLKLILRDKLVENNIDLAGPPFTNSDMAVCGSSLTALAIRFAEELKTHFIDVLERLEELWMIARNNELCSTICTSPSRGVYSGTQSLHYGYPHHYHPHPHLMHHYPGSPRNQPPPLPSCPPPATMSSNYIDRCTNLQTHLDGGHIRPDPLAHQNYVALDGAESAGASEEKKKGGSVFGRFLRNIGFRRSNRKGTYKQHQGDLNAYEISMSDEDRMALMVLVKEGKISTQTALAVVQKYEEEKRVLGKSSSHDDGKENVCETPSKKGGNKKKKGGKPSKSQSTFSADDPHRCLTCPQVTTPDEFDHPCDHQMCRQRRVHSLGQLDVPLSRPPLERQHELQHDGIVLTRAVSCSPACTPSHKLTSQVDSPAMARFHSPSHHQLQQQLQHQHQQYHHHYHHNLNKVDALRERLTGKAVNAVPKTSSKTSLLSSGSDQSMECGSQTPLRTDPMSRQAGDTAAYNSNSTVSMSSDTNSPAQGRKKSGGLLDPRLKTHRSASCSTGDDGISSENDDTENSSRRLQQHEALKGKLCLESNIQRSMKMRDAISTRPPLLRQQSAPVGSHYGGPYLGQARVIVDYTPKPEEEDFIPLKQGEIVNIINMAQSGVWRGVVGGKKGKFRFEHVEVVIEPDKVQAGSAVGGQKDVPRSVNDLLQKIGLGHLTTLFMLNGYDDLDIFSELDDHDLDTLHISDPDHRTKLLSAAKILGDWNEKMGAQTPAPTNMDSPSSRAGNSSCDSGCYAGNEGLKHQTKRRGGGNGEKKGHRSEGYHPGSHSHSSCRSCGKPKQPRKLSGPAALSHYTPGHYGTQMPHSAPGHMPHTAVGRSPYAPGHFQYTSSVQYGSPQQCGPYTPGHYGTSHYAGGHNYPGQDHSHYAMSVSRTLTELNVPGNSSAPPRLETFTGGRKQSSTMPSPVYGDKQSLGSGHSVQSDKGSLGDRVSLTEEDKEIIAITNGTNQPRKLSTPLQTVPSGPSQIELSNTMLYNACVPASSGCQQCDDAALCESASCPQCAAYMSCPQCFPYRHYVNTTMRSDSKSSKMSCSSTCTQTTCLSPDNEENGHSGGSSHAEYITSPQAGYYMSSPGKSPYHYMYQQQFIHAPHSHTPSIPGSSVSQLPSPAPAPAGLATTTTPPLTLALADPSSAQGLALTLQQDAQPALTNVPDWTKQQDSNDEPGIATLYRRRQNKTPEKAEKSDSGQVKSPTRSLMPLVSTKLSAERIDLTQLPYSTAIGHCGIPPLLVQRYSEELRQDIETMGIVLEQLREKQLRGLGRPCIQNESLSDSCKNACDLQISSIQNFLMSIGLPMYQKSLTEGGITTLEQLLKLKESELEQMTGADSRHLRRIAHALEWVQRKLASPSHKARATGVTDKV